jgi:Protein of unknown function (DUF998)
MPLNPLIQSAGVLRSVRPARPGNLTRWALLYVWLPLIAVSYFGTLTVAAWRSQQAYDWRRQAISKLLYPGYDPQFHYVASLGVAVAGLLMLPLAVYIARQMRRVCGGAADAGASALGLGAVGLMLAGLIVSHPAHGRSAFPMLHEILARAAAFALGAGMLALWGCAARVYLARPDATREWRPLLVSWSLVTLPALTIALLKAAATAQLHWSNPIYQRLESRTLWPLGFWEWLGSAAVFLFLLSAVLYLPEQPRGREHE